MKLKLKKTVPIGFAEQIIEIDVDDILEVHPVANGVGTLRIEYRVSPTQINISVFNNTAQDLSEQIEEIIRLEGLELEEIWAKEHPEEIVELPI